ncbi:ERMES complex subunit [Boothiomyces macroporosus]|uniref:ERMES complex subunit n=1 Tax=Boothiomyces macroporosus TaxID=261099 RepID=A0AAD5UFA6_9FUNG|nr:ERMES complex subunit [Boothiomyces macroporosus]
MSFKVNWPSFSSDFIEKATEQLTTALNTGKKPENIVGDITVTALNMGTKVFVINQVVPMQMRISKLKLKGIIVLVVDKERGITLVFKNDPLESVNVNSTFDNIPNIRQLLQRQIEKQLRNMFQEELPQMIHNLSLLLLQKEISKKSEETMPLNEKFSTDLPHDLKWRGNDPVSGYSSDEERSGYILYKSLNSSQENAELGLQKLVDSRNSSRIFIEEDIEIQGYYQVGLGKMLNNQAFDMHVTPPTPSKRSSFIGMSPMANRSYKPSRPIFVDDDSESVHSAWTAPPTSNAQPLLQTDGMHYQRPSVHKRPSNLTTKPTVIKPRMSPIQETPENYRVILSPSDNEVTAHLANLMTNHLTISPNTQDLKNFTFRGNLPYSSSQVGLDIMETQSLPDQFSYRRSVHRRKAHRRVHTVKVPTGMFTPSRPASESGDVL